MSWTQGSSEQNAKSSPQPVVSSFFYMRLILTLLYSPLHYSTLYSYCTLLYSALPNYPYPTCSTLLSYLVPSESGKLRLATLRAAARREELPLEARVANPHWREGKDLDGQGWSTSGVGQNGPRRKSRSCEALHMQGRLSYDLPKVCGILTVAGSLRPGV